MEEAMNKRETAWRLRRHTAFIAAMLIAAILLTLTIYYISDSRPDPNALTVGLEDGIIVSISESRIAQVISQGADIEKIRVIKPSLYSVVQPDPQTNKYALFEQLLISQSCDLMLGTASTARQLSALGLIMPIPEAGFEFDGEYLAGCVELGYVDFTGQGDYLYHGQNDTVCAYVLANSNNKEEAAAALGYIKERFSSQ